MRPNPLVATVVLLTACASTPPAATGERGLALLRDRLGLLPPAGRVEHDARGAWLVDAASGLRLPVSTAAAPACITAPVTPDGGAQWRLFEGAPGAALAFRGLAVTLYAYDAARACVVASDPFPGLALGPREPVGKVEWSQPAPAAGTLVTATPTPDVAAVVAAQTLSQPLALPGRPAPLTVELALDRLEVRDAAGAVVFEDTLGDLESAPCGSTFSASLARAPAADGSTVLSVSLDSRTVTPFDSGDDQPAACGAEDVERHAALEVEVVFPASDATPFVASRSVTQMSSADGGQITSVTYVPIASGRLRFDSTEEEFLGRNGLNRSLNWTWSYEPAGGGAQQELASGTEYL